MIEPKVGSDALVEIPIDGKRRGHCLKDDLHMLAEKNC
jgi:hypothetical protein